MNQGPSVLGTWTLWVRFKDPSRDYKIVPVSNPMSTLNVALPCIMLAVAHIAISGNGVGPCPFLPSLCGG